MPRSVGSSSAAPEIRDAVSGMSIMMVFILGVSVERRLR